MEAKHTQGPWIVAHDRKNPIVEAAALEDADGIWHNGGFIIGRFFGDDARENAALVTAAPDLLAALEAIKNELDLWGDDSLETFNLTACLKQITVAIAKAKGK